MAGANSNIQVADLDFNLIKNNLKTFLQAQSQFQDYNFDGSALSTLLDILAYNTQYNAFYLNMVANEAFLDSAVQRSSVVSHAKMLNYVPQSAIGAVGVVNLSFNVPAGTSTLTIPQYTNFLSEQIDGVNYNYVTTDSISIPVVAGMANTSGVELKQGTFASYSFTVDLNSNPECLFEIPDSGIDTSTLQVQVQQSSSNASFQTFYPTSNYLALGPTDQVYFLQEAVDGNYQIYFGDGVLGQSLTQGNIVNVNYITTSGSAGGLANNWTLMDNLGTNITCTVYPQQSATQGQDKESIQSIKFQAPKSFSAQGRAVSKNDYVTLIQQNSLGFQFDAVSVWGGEENNPPVYGQVFISLKPKGAYNLTETQKNVLISQVIKPISVVTVEPTIIDPDYVYLQVTANVLYQVSQTNSSPGTLQQNITQSIYNYAAANLNTFNSAFDSYSLLSAINNTDNSIVSSDFSVTMQKKFYPTLGTATTYNLYYNTPIKRGIYGSTLTSAPGFEIVDPSNASNTISGIYLAEVPSTTSQVGSIAVLNTGYNYLATPTVNIVGDGTGATAIATIVNGYVASVTVTNPGVGYTTATAYIVNAAGDAGTGAQLSVILENQLGNIKAYYNDPVLGEVIVGSNVGTIDYDNGIVTLNNFSPINVSNGTDINANLSFDLGELTIAVQPTTNIIPSSYNRIITIDPYDPAAVLVTVNAKRS